MFRCLRLVEIFEEGSCGASLCWLLVCLSSKNLDKNEDINQSFPPGQQKQLVGDTEKARSTICGTQNRGTFKSEKDSQAGAECPAA